MKKIAVIKGDGIGPELIGHALAVARELGIDSGFEFIEAEAGLECFKKNGTSIPEETVEIARDSDAVLFGAVTTPPAIANYKSAIVTLRKRLDLFANLRPIRSFEGVPSLFQNVNLAIVRENTEGMYSGIEEIAPDKSRATATRIITRRGSERIARFAFNYARQNGFSKVSIVHKANILRETCGLFREIALQVSLEHRETETEEVLVDTMAMRLLKNPQSFGVVVTTNLFGDILSDEAAQLVGGLGMVPSANIGEKNALFEPAHGSAPKYAGLNVANPCATLLSLELMLRHLREEKSANELHKAIETVLREGKHTTRDIGGNAKTSEMVEAISRKINTNREIALVS